MWERERTKLWLNNKTHKCTWLNFLKFKIWIWSANSFLLSKWIDKITVFNRIFADVWLKCCAPLSWIWGVHCNVDNVVWTGYIWNNNNNTKHSTWSTNVGIGWSNKKNTMHIATIFSIIKKIKLGIIKKLFYVNLGILIYNNIAKSDSVTFFWSSWKSTKIML